MKEKSKEEQGKRLEKIRNETPRTLPLWGNIPARADCERAPVGFAWNANLILKLRCRARLSLA